jgi:hypothetical protein
MLASILVAPKFLKKMIRVALEVRFLHINSLEPSQSTYLICPMAEWIYEKPIDDCNEHELLVAKWLECLPSGYIVRWGYYYQDNANVWREGDFLILGPDGHLMILEVKKRIQHDAHTGKFAGKGGASPVEQVLMQKSSVLSRLAELGRTDRKKYFLPYILPVLAGCENHAGDPKPSGLDPKQVWLDIKTWANPESYWELVFAEARECPNPAGVRRLFLDVLGENVGGLSAKRCLAQTDRQLVLQATRDYDLLDQLAENRVLLVRGGPGSGKSWLAQEAAIRDAKAGRHVLFLCYNLDFASDTADKFTKRSTQITPGRITIWSWQQLVDEISREAAIPLKEPEDRNDQRAYFAEIVPQAMLDAATSGKVKPRFDSLIVDEAQDHDTTSRLGISWWEIYLSLLRSPETARVGVFFDPAQRPAFRDRDGGKFDASDLQSFFPGAVRVTLSKTRRYTDGLAAYLRSLDSEGTASLAAAIQPGHDLPGPPPIVDIADSLNQALTKANQTVKKWIAEKGVDPRDILVLTKRRPFEGDQPTIDPNSKLGGYSVIAADDPQPPNPPYSIRCTSFHKSKGLDAQAVVMLGTWAYEELSPDDQFAYFLAASRARQLLAIFPHKKK